MKTTIKIYQTTALYAVIGDTTNVASRICSAAEAGEIPIDGSTRASIEPAALVVEPTPVIIARGEDQPVPVHRVLRRRT